MSAAALAPAAVREEAPDGPLTAEDRIIDAAVDRHLFGAASSPAETPSETETDDDVAAERARLLDAADWKTLLVELTKYAAKRDYKGCSWMDPDDYAQTAVAIVRTPGYSLWSPRREPELLRHLKSVCNGVMRNAATLAESHGPHATARGGDEHVGHARAVGPTPERAAAMRELVEALKPRLRARFGENGVRFCEIACASVEEQAAALGMTLFQMYTFRRRVKEYCLEVREEIGLPLTGDFLPRYTPSPEAAALAEEIDAMIPGRLVRKYQGCLVALFLLACAGGCIAFAAWLFLQG